LWENKSVQYQSKGEEVCSQAYDTQQIMAEHLQNKSEGEQKKLSAIHNSVSECHTPNLREKKKG